MGKLGFDTVGWGTAASFALALIGCGDSGEAGGGAAGGAAAGGNPATGGAAQGGAATGGASGTYQAVPNTYCAPETQIGSVVISGYPTAPYVQAELWDRPSPLYGAPELTNATCAFYHYAPGACSTCPSGEVCSAEGACAVDRRTIKDGTLTLRAGSDEQSFATDPTLGGLYGTLTLGSADATFEASLAWGDVTVELPATAYAAKPLGNVMVLLEGDYSAPGALDATWDPPAEGGFVLTTIPMNHHAAAPTFTFCAAPASAGAIHADAEMVDPLAVITGLEFQGLDYVEVAAAETPAGCVEFRVGVGRTF